MGVSLSPKQGKIRRSFDRGEYFETPVDTGSAIRGNLGTIGFVKGRLEDERKVVPRCNLSDRASGFERARLILDDVEPADECERRPIANVDRSDTHVCFSNPPQEQNATRCGRTRRVGHESPGGDDASLRIVGDRAHDWSSVQFSIGRSTMRFSSCVCFLYSLGPTQFRVPSWSWGWSPLRWQRA